MAAIVRLGPPLAIFLLTAPVLFGLAGTILPAFGYLPVLGGMEFTTGHIIDILARPGIGVSATISLASGLVTAFISLAATMLFVSAFAGTRLFSHIQHIVSPLLAVPHAAAAFGLAFLLTPSGMISRLLSPELTGWTTPPDILIVHDPYGISMMSGLIVKEIPFLLLMTLAALPQVKIIETRALVASLGYGRIAGFVFTLWPAIYGQIRLAVLAVIVFASSVVDVAAILGPTTPATLAVRLVEWMRDPELTERYVASAGALLQLFVTAAAVLIWMVLEKLGRVIRLHACDKGMRMRNDKWLARTSLFVILAVVFLVAAGLGTLVIWSIAGLWQFPDLLPENFSLRTWKLAAPRLYGPLATTLLVALLSTLLASLISILCLIREADVGNDRSRGIWLLYLPLIVPQAAFLFGLQYMFVLIGFDATLFALIFTHLVFVLPYVFLSLSDPWRAFDQRYETIAKGLGKSRWIFFFKIRLPMMLRALLTAAAVGFAVSIALYLPTVLIGAGRLVTITTEAVALASGGNSRVIGVYAFLQMLLPFIAFFLATIVPALLFRSRREMHI